MKDSLFSPSRLMTLRTRNSAAYKGLYALLLKDGAQDFRTGVNIDEQVYFDERIDIHHIFPQHWCRHNSIAPQYCDSIVNKAPLSAKTNRIIGGNAPSVYLDRMQRGAEIAAVRMDAIIRTQVIEPSTLREDKFDVFFQKRTEELLGRIEQAMGKPVARDSTPETVDTSTDYTDEDEVD